MRLGAQNAQAVHYQVVMRQYLKTLREISNVGHAPYCEDASSFNKAIEVFFD